MIEYEKFLETKIDRNRAAGLSEFKEFNHNLFESQREVTKWGLSLGRFAVFAGTGLGKTIMELETAKQIGGKTIIIAPLGPARQIIQEADKFGFDANFANEDGDIIQGINVTNYEKIDRFENSDFDGVILDESSILKSFTGRMRQKLKERFFQTRFRACFTATPAPNDYTELGTTAEFLGVMKRAEMLATYFIHDGGETAKWRLKGHAEKRFWQWVAEWAIMYLKPSQIGFPDDDYELPGLNYYEHIVNVDVETPGFLFAPEAKGLNERREARKQSIRQRAEKAAEIVNGSDEQWMIWCGLNDESTLAKELIERSIEVKGADKDDHKVNSALDFANGKIKRMISKPKIYGFGMNFQSCHNVVFLGLNDSWETFYQAIRRFWRRGQEKDVNVHIVISDQEGAVLENIKRKEKRAAEMINGIISEMNEFTKRKLKGSKIKMEYESKKEERDYGTLYHGDSVEILRELESNSIHYSIFSPPFSSLYTYSDSERDLGNSKNDCEFMEHYKYIVAELFRVLKPGRLVSFHCADIPAMKERDGYIGLKDFPGDSIKLFEDVGFVYHSRVLIWKDPLVEVTRTKAHGLMHKQIVKDSAKCRQGLPDYIITMMKPGENQEPVAHKDGFADYIGENPPTESAGPTKFSHYIWQKYASPVWMDIKQNDTLNFKAARENRDERHICPLQLDVIARCLELWTNPGDLVLSPFMGIGSEGYESVKRNRRFIGIELKESYFREAVKNIDQGKSESLGDLFNVQDEAV